MTIDVENFAIVTPSYHRDYEPCRLLVDSVNRYVEDKIKHYLIVPKSDYCLFRHLESSRTIVKFQEDFLPWWIIPTVFSKKWYLSLKTFPIRGWIRQQIVKLSIGEMLPESVYLIIDSDTFFVKRFSLDNFVKGDSISLYREIADEDWHHFDDWQRKASRLFKLDNFKPDRSVYVAPFLFWKKENLQSMFRTIETTQKKSWQRALCSQLRLSEYTLYGVYVSQVMGIEKSGHYYDSVKHTHDYYGRVPLSISELQSFRQKLKDHHLAVSISAHSLTRLNDIRGVFGF